ncbi:MAG: sigma factor G inhibitor Gin [Carboxydocellales bacterium]
MHSTEEIVCRLCGQSFEKRGIGGFFLRGKYVCSHCESHIVLTHSRNPHYDWLLKEIKQMLVT